MPWVFNDSKGNIKESVTTTVTRPMARVTQGAAQSVTNGVQTALTFSGVAAADYDTYSTPMFASATPGRLTAPLKGHYRITASVAYVATGAQFNNAVELRKNGTTALSGTTIGWSSSGDGSAQGNVVAIELALNQGDYIEILSYQQGGAARNTVPAGTFLAMEYMDGAVATTVVGYSPPSIDSGWIVVGAAGAPAFANGWVNYGASWGVARFRRDALGYVHLSGLVKGGTVGQNIFVLPSGFLPDVDGTNTNGLIWVTASNDAFGEIRINPAGGVYLSSGSNSWATLDSVCFKAA